MKWGRTDRPADQPQDGPVRDAARPGSYVGNVLGSCVRGKRPASEDLIADRRVVKLRPVLQEPCRRREEPASVQGALRPGCPGFRIGIGGAVLDPSTDSRSGKAFIPRGTPSGEQGSIRQAAPGRGWTLQVSRAGNSGKARNCVNYRPNIRPKGRPATGKSAPYAPIARSDLAPMWQTPDRA